MRAVMPPLPSPLPKVLEESRQQLRTVLLGAKGLQVAVQGLGGLEESVAEADESIRALLSERNAALSIAKEAEAREAVAQKRLRQVCFPPLSMPVYLCSLLLSPHPSCSPRLLVTCSLPQSPAWSCPPSYCSCPGPAPPLNNQQPYLLVAAIGRCMEQVEEALASHEEDGEGEGDDILVRIEKHMVSDEGLSFGPRKSSSCLCVINYKTIVLGRPVPRALVVALSLLILI